MALIRRFIHNQGRLEVRPVVRVAEELFSTTVRNFSAANGPTLIINGNFYDLSSAGLIDALAGNDPVAASETSPLGHVISNGRRVAGGSAARDFYLAFDASKAFNVADLTLAFSSGQGDPPALSAAFGGLGPLIINGLPYGSSNEYGPGAPAGAPLAGEPPAAARRYLRRRSSAKFAAFAARDNRSGGRLGKTCVGVSPTEVMVFVQEDGTSGATIDAVRDEFVAAGCKHGVFFDGSDSAMLFTRESGFLIRQGPDKDETCTVGVAFLWYPRP